MKRLRHWLFNFVAATSVLLMVVSICAWVNSYSHSFSAVHFAATDVAGRSRDFYTLSSAGSVVIGYKQNGASRRPRSSFDFRFGTHPPQPPRLAHDFGGFGYESRTTQLVDVQESLAQPRQIQAAGADFSYELCMPYWFLTVVLVFTPIRRICKALAIRSGAGLCGYCGYDLRATPEQCPECGRSQIALEQG